MKKRLRNAQVSMEFIMVIALSMMILLPGIYLFRNYAFESSDQITTARLNEVSNIILMKAKKMYYYGPPSKSTIELDMPPQLGSMYVIANPDNTEETEYYLGFSLLTSRGTEEITYYSDVPLKIAGLNITGNCDVCLDYDYCSCGNMTYYDEGRKNIQVTASDDCDYSDFCIILSLI
jgi:hypothetical protein